MKLVGVLLVVAACKGQEPDRAARGAASRLVADHLSYPIVGAGVSTCAPVLERAPG